MGGVSVAKDRFDDLPKEIGKRIKYLRESAGIEVSKLAERAGVSANTIYNYEKGEKLERAKSLAHVASGLNVSLVDLFSGSLPGEKKGIEFINDSYEGEKRYLDLEKKSEIVKKVRTIFSNVHRLPELRVAVAGNEVEGLIAHRVVNEKFSEKMREDREAVFRSGRYILYEIVPEIRIRNFIKGTDPYAQVKGLIGVENYPRRRAQINKALSHLKKFSNRFKLGIIKQGEYGYGRRMAHWALFGPSFGQPPKQAIINVSVGDLFIEDLDVVAWLDERFNLLWNSDVCIKSPHVEELLEKMITQQSRVVKPREKTK